MKNKGPVLFVLLDAFRWDYLDPDETPYLWDLAHNSVYVKQLKPNFGFCERSELFTGTHPVTNGYFTAWKYDPDESPFSQYRGELKVLDLFTRLFNNKYAWYALHRYFQTRGYPAPIHKMPLSLAPLFALTEDAREHWQKGGFSVESIFDIMLDQQMSFYHDTFTSLTLRNGSDQNRIDSLLTHAHKQHQLFLLYLGSPDSVCHRYGVGSTEFRLMLQQVDSWIAQIHSQFLAHHKDLSLVLVGDHGMTNATLYLDIQTELRNISKEANIKHGRDYLMFLDSTMARFWFKTDKAEVAIRAMTLDPPFVDNGRILTKELAQELRVPSPPNEYGDFIWWANPGVVVYPDYFHTYRPVKAMHGYHPGHQTAKGMAIVNYPAMEVKKIREANLVDICPTLCDLLQIRYPVNNQGRCLL